MIGLIGLIVISLIVFGLGRSGGSGSLTRLGRMNQKELDEWYRTHPRPKAPVGRQGE